MIDSKISSFKIPVPHSLNFNNRFKKHPFRRLPFVSQSSCWAVPNSGGYSGGCATGGALAAIYIDHLREHGTSPLGLLQHMALDMFDVKPTPDNEALRGQAVGFFTALEKWLEVIAKLADEQDRAALLRSANNGLNFDEAAYVDSLPDD